MAPGSLLILTVAYGWNYPRKPQDGFNMLRDDERRTFNLFMEELGFKMEYKIANIANKEWGVDTLDEGDYLYIIGRRE